MRYLIAIVLLLGVFTASAQKNKFKGAGFDYTKTAPNYIPVRGTESEIAIDSLTGKWMQYSYQSAEWWHLGYFVTETGTSGAPSYTPNKVKSVMAINAGDSLYHYRSGTWYLIAGGGGGAGITDGDKGDVDVTGGGTVWTIDTGAVTMIKINQDGAAVGQVIKWNGTSWAPANDNTLAAGAGGIYGPSDLVTYHHTATVDSGLTFSSAEDTAYFNIIMAPGAFGSAAYFNSDSIRLRRYDVGGSNEVILNSDGVLLKTTTPDRVTIQGADARYAADYRATYSDRSLIDKKYGDDFYLQEVDSLRVSNDTLYISLARDSVPEKFVVLPASDDTSGYNLDFRISNDTLYIEDADGALFVDLDPYKDNTDTSGYNIGARISGDTLYIRDGNGEVAVELPADSDGQTLSIDSVSLESGERFIITISNGNTISFDIPADTDNQQIDTFSIANSIISLSLQDDALPASTIDIAESVQDITGAMVESNTETGIAVTYDDGAGKLNFVAVDQSLTNELQFPDTFEIVSDELRLSLFNDGLPFKTVNLAPYLDNTDTQTLTVDSTDVGGIIERFEVSISNGNSVYIDVPQVSGSGAGQNNVGQNLGSGTGVYAGKVDTILQFKSLVEGYGIDLSNTSTEITIKADTAQVATLHDVAVVQGDIDAHESADGDLDDTNELQSLTIDSVAITGKERFLLEISDGNTVAFDVDLNTDDQTLILDSAIVGSVERFELEVSNGNSVFFDIPQATDTDNQTLDTFEIVSNILRASLTDDGVPFKSVDLSSYLDNTDAQNLSYTASSRSLEISGGTGINIPLFSQFGTNAGLVSGSNTATTNFLRGDNTWQPVITTEVDGSISNEGVLGVGAGSGTSSTLLSTTSGSNAVTINAAGILAITESTSANGGSITLTATEVDGSITNEIQNLTYTAATGVVAIDGTGSTDATIPVMTASVRGLTPDGDGSGTDEFLREDATWGVPPGVTNLTITGSGPTYTIDSNTGTDVIISASGITLSESPANTLVFTAVDASVTNEIQTLDTFEIASNILRASLLNDGVPFKSVDLSSYLDNTDEQDLSIDSVSITGKERFTIDITNGTSVSFDVDINTDTQDLSIDSASTTGGQNFTIGLTDGGSVSLFIPTDTDTDEQTLVLDSTDLTGIERYALGITDGNTVYFDDDDRQTLDTFEIVSNTLRASATEDGVPFKSVDLSPYVNTAIPSDQIAYGSGTGITSTFPIKVNTAITASSINKTYKVRVSGENGSTYSGFGADSIAAGQIAFAASSIDNTTTDWYANWIKRDGGLGDIISVIQHTNANASSNATQLISVNASGGDPTTQYAVGATTVSVGIDNSDSDIWKVDYASALDGTYSIGVGSTGLVGIGGAPVTGKALAITGELAISDLNASTTATVVLGADGSGNVESLGLSGLSVSSGTLTATDPSLSNEGTLGVSAGASNTSVITSNTSGATGVTVTAGIAMTISESTSSNGGTITLNADTTILATIHDVAVSGGTDTNIYTTDGDIKAGGTILDASGNDGLYFLVDNAATADDYVIRMAADYAADDAITHWLHTTTGTDSLDIYSYDDGLYMKWEGTSGAGEGFTISSNTILNLTADSVRVQSLPARTTLPFMVGLQGNTLSKIEGATDGQVLVWDETNGGFWEIGTSAGADGNGIYDGSDIIPDGTIATIESGGAFTFDYDGGADAIKFDDATGYVRITDKTGSSQLQVLGTAALVQGDGQSSVVGGGNSLTINEDQFVFTADTGTVRLTLFEPSGGGTNYTMFTQPAMAASQIYALPTDAPANGDVLSWNTGGTLSWEAGGGADGDGIYDGDGTLQAGVTSVLLPAGATLQFEYDGASPGLVIDDITNTAYISGQNATYAVYAGNSDAGITHATGGWLTGSTYALTGSALVANTSTVTDRLIIQGNVASTVPANGFGSGILFQGESSTTDNQNMARITAAWTTVTHASREAKIGVQLGNSAGALAEIANFNVSGSSTGQLSIGSSSAVTIQNSGITTGNSTFTIGNSSNQLLLTTSQNSAAGLTLANTSNTSSSVGAISVGGSTSFTQTSGTRSYMIFDNNFAPTSGTAIHNRLLFSGTVNQTGGANGIVRAVYDNPTLTAVADYRSFQTDVNTANAKGFVQTGASSTNNFVGNTAVGTASTPNASALIDMVSTTKGFGAPVMTDTERDAIGSPREGLVVYTTDQDALSLRDNGIWKRLPTTRTILKTADETVNNSSTYQADDHLIFTAKANKKYVVKYYLYVEDVAFNGSNGAMKLKVTAPSATTLRYGATGGAGLAAAYGDSGTDVTVTDVFGSTPNEGHVILTAYINPGASDRTVTLEWAQITADASDTKILEGSFMEYEEIN